MKRFGLVLLFLAGASAGWGQTIELKSGQIVEAGGIRREGDAIMVKIVVGQSNGEIGYPLSGIARINFPEPVVLAEARSLFGQGQVERSLQQLEPILTKQAPFRQIPGSWWPPAALLQARALSALHREGEAEQIAREIRGVAADPEIQRAADLQLAAGLLRLHKYDELAPICDAAIQQSADESVLAEAWKLKGDLMTARKQWDDALMAYLRVPVFYREQTIILPAALLGSGRAYRRLGDNERARRTANDLIVAFPKSPEAVLAQKELLK